MRIGAQMFTVTDFCKDLNSFAESLKKVADMGYEFVQISGTCDYEPQWLKEQLQKNGLKCVLTHIPINKLKADPIAVAKNHDIFDCKHVGLGWYAFEDSDEKQRFDDFFEIIPTIAKSLKEQGKYFMYHNHAHEFKKYNCKTVFEQLVQRIPADLMGFTLDTYWIQVGGSDSAYWLERLKGRVPVIHLKDYAYHQLEPYKFEPRTASIGDGNINFDRVFEKAESAGTEYMLVEHDQLEGADPFDSLKRSYAYLKSHGFK